MHVWNVQHTARWKYRTQKIAILPPSHNFVGLYLHSWGMYRQSEKNLLNIDTSSTCPHNTVNVGLLTAEIYWRVWGTPANFNSFRVMAALLHGTLVVGVSQTSRRWTEGATYIWQGDHHVGHWPTFYTVSQKKGCHPNHGYNFVNFWRVCKILSPVQRAVNFQQNQY